MVVDTSAVIAILLDEAEADRFSKVLGDASNPVMSAVTRVEHCLVIEGRYREAGRADLETFLRESESK